MSNFIASKEDDYSKWYLDIVQKAKLADYSPVKGCMVIMPYGYSIWSKIQSILDKNLKRLDMRMHIFLCLFLMVF